MPDPDPTPARNWPEAVERIFDKVLKFLAPFALLYLGLQGNNNSRQIQQIENRQVTNREEDKPTKLINMLGTWKWLEEVAVQSGKQKDKDAAERARKVYEEFKATMNGD